MVNITEKSHFMIIKEARDGKFAEAVSEAIKNGWRVVNVIRESYNKDHMGYLTK